LCLNLYLTAEGEDALFSLTSGIQNTYRKAPLGYSSGSSADTKGS